MEDDKYEHLRKKIERQNKRMLSLIELLDSLIDDLKNNHHEIVDTSYSSESYDTEYEAKLIFNHHELKKELDSISSVIKFEMDI